MTTDGSFAHGRLDASFMRALADAASASPRRRRHFNLHADYADPCQRLLNAMRRDSYIRPHRHLADPKAETLFALKGRFAFVTFDDEGAVTAVTPFASEAHLAGPADLLGVEVAVGLWHTVVALSDEAVLLEIKAGPFRPDAAKEPAPWAPEEGSDAGAAYLATLAASAAASTADAQPRSTRSPRPDKM